MEKIPALLQKLDAQFRQSDWAGMQVTLQILQSELHAYQQPVQTTGRISAKVAVVLPTPPPEHAIYVQSPLDEPAAESSPANPKISHWPEVSLQEVPTLSHQKPFQREVNESLAAPDNSLNEQLRAPKNEVADSLGGSPIKDLKRGIGINDRFLFIQELFRGDEVMYERSIKTINNFQILAEAEYWIERELKLKLGWQEDQVATRHFCALVRRRFVT
jgi:hypothetical protein